MNMNSKLTLKNSNRMSTREIIDKKFQQLAAIKANFDNAAKSDKGKYYKEWEDMCKILENDIKSYQLWQKRGNCGKNKAKL